MVSLKAVSVCFSQSVATLKLAACSPPNILQSTKATCSNLHSIALSYIVQLHSMAAGFRISIVLLTLGQTASRAKKTCHSHSPCFQPVLVPLMLAVKRGAGAPASFALAPPHSDQQQQRVSRCGPSLRCTGGLTARATRGNPGFSNRRRTTRSHRAARPLSELLVAPPSEYPGASQCHTDGGGSPGKSFATWWTRATRATRF